MNCSNRCTCANDAKCDSIDGTCFCAPGFEGEFCDDICHSWSYGESGSSSCSCNQTNAVSCDHVTGDCNCDRFWTGKVCEEWNCPKGKFGAECEYNCSCVDNGICESRSGKCLCPDGFEGKDCELYIIMIDYIEFLWSVSRNFDNNRL